MRRNIYLVLFTYSAQPCLPVMSAIVATMFALAQRGWDMSFNQRAGNCMLPLARNAAAADFLSDDFTDMVMIDDDNWCDADGILRLLDAPVDVVAAPCRGKQDEFKWPVRYCTDRPVARDPVTGLIEVDTVGTGIIRMTRAAVERLAAAHADEWYADPATVGGRALPLFMYEIADRTWWGEDVSFCHKWRALGGSVWIDPDIETHHIGMKDFSGSIGQWLAAMPGKLKVIEVRDNSETVVNNALSLTAVREIAA